MFNITGYFCGFCLLSICLKMAEKGRKMLQVYHMFVYNCIYLQCSCWCKYGHLSCCKEHMDSFKNNAYCWFIFRNIGC